MVAIVHQSASLNRVISYNEHKVKAGRAVCLVASGFIKEAAQLSFSEKLHRFEKLTSLNQRTAVNSLHISLNFDVSESLSDERLLDIAAAYLDRIGFAEQPFLVYRHMDAGHPHMHLVTTNIRPDGTAITLHNLAKNKSEPARLAIEKLFGLVPAQGNRQSAAVLPEPVSVARLNYGKAETKMAVARVLNFVLKNYAFSTLAQFNAVLGLYHVAADPGSDESRVRRYDGLVFRVLDVAGKTAGPPLKASLFACKPTLKNLRDRFVQKASKKQGKEARLRTVIDLALIYDRADETAFTKALRRDGIDVVWRRNDAGLAYGITYVDHLGKVVFNGSELGKAYSAKAVLDRFEKRTVGGQKTELSKRSPATPAETLGGVRELGNGENTESAMPAKTSDVHGWSAALLAPEVLQEQMDWQLKRKRRKRKRVKIE